MKKAKLILTILSSISFSSSLTLAQPKKTAPKPAEIEQQSQYKYKGKGPVEEITTYDKGQTCTFRLVGNVVHMTPCNYEISVRLYTSEAKPAIFYTSEFERKANFVLPVGDGRYFITITGRNPIYNSEFPEPEAEYITMTEEKKPTAIQGHVEVKATDTVRGSKPVPVLPPVKMKKPDQKSPVELVAKTEIVVTGQNFIPAPTAQGHKTKQ